MALASPIVYGSTIRDGQTGLIFSSPSEFASHLDRLSTTPPCGRSLASSAYRYVAENRMLSQHFRERHEWYCELLDRLPELTRELRERVPEMGEVFRCDDMMSGDGKWFDGGFSRNSLAPASRP